MNSKISLKVIKPKPVVVPQTIYNLTLALSERDARAIMDLCDRIGGKPEASARGVFDNISEKLKSAGLTKSVAILQAKWESLSFKEYVDC